jgi:hypothetical protein
MKHDADDDLRDPTGMDDEDAESDKCKRTLNDAQLS